MVQSVFGLKLNSLRSLEKQFSHRNRHVNKISVFPIHYAFLDRILLLHKKRKIVVPYTKFT